jgi:intergrase/recombinase
LREGETDHAPEGIPTFNEFYETHREGFEKWLSRRVKEGDLSDRSRKDYLSAVDRYLIEEADDDIVKPIDFRNMAGDKQTRAVKNLFNYLEDIGMENPSGYPLNKWRQNVIKRKLPLLLWIP